MLNFTFGNLYWAQMPLSEAELAEIPEKHRIRPYLVFASADENLFYAFASTSKEPDPIAIESYYVTTGSSSIKLEQCYCLSLENLNHFNQSEEGMLVPFNKLSKRTYSELIKKLKLNIDYDETIYPQKVVNKIRREYYHQYFNNKDILFNGSKYIVCLEENEDGYKVCDISFVPTEGYAEFLVNGYKCYVSPETYTLDSLYGEYEVFLVSSNLPTVLNTSKACRSKVESTTDVNNIDTLPVGSVIGYNYDDEEKYILIKTREDEEKVYFLLGREGSYQRDYIEYSFLKGSDFMYEFYHILGKDKLTYSLTKIRKN